MPVTFTVANHQATNWATAKIDSTDALFAASCSRSSKNSQKLIQSSISRRDLRKRHISASNNGLIWAVVHAYNEHHHLVFRPEDIWFAILCQLSFYVNAHAEELRDYFVSHTGRKELVLEYSGRMEQADFGALARCMTTLIQDNVKEPRLREWIMPSFTTTTDCDRTVAAVLMMGSMQKYFSYRISRRCGIPSVTLLGERGDWEDILRRLDYLSELGTQPDTFATLLKPIVREFVASFDSNLSASTKEFWGKIVHRESGGSGGDCLSGWITAFAFWNERGKAPFVDAIVPDGPYVQAGCVLGNVRYPCIGTDKVPAGFAAVPVTVEDGEQVWNAEMVAGSVGIEAKRGDGQVINTAIYRDVDGGVSVEGELRGMRGPVEERTGYAGLDTLQPLTGWFMHTVGPSV